MSKKTVVILVILLMVVVAGLLVWYFSIETPTNKNINVASTEVIAPPKDTVWILQGNFTPSVIKVATGDKVTWVNKDVIRRRVASDPHPTGAELPQLVSSDLQQGDSFSFSFTNKGEWGYHDFLNPIKKGKVVVQ